MHIFIMLMTSVQSFKLTACKPWEELITQTCSPTLKANLKIVLSRKCRNFVKKFFRLQKFTCTFSIYPQQVCMVSKCFIENCKRSWFHKLHTLQWKSCLKWLSSKGCNSVKINSSSTKNPHAYLQYVHNRYARFQKYPLKLWEELITQTLYRKAWRTDGQTDGRTGANLNAPWLSSRGHKNKKIKMEKKINTLPLTLTPTPWRPQI